ncbi:hypothetical protein BBJ28_00016622, partial [Nothophytophthora sp. Chile5]
MRSEGKCIPHHHTGPFADIHPPRNTETMSGADVTAEMQALATSTPPPAPAKMSKNALKKAMRAEKSGGAKPKKEKDPNRWAPKADKKKKEA